MSRAGPQQSEALDDLALAARAAARDAQAIRLITGRNNQRLYRTAWSILKSRAEAEEAVQEAYAKAFQAISGFRGASSLSTWLMRIVINEALTRRRALERRTRFLERNQVADLETYRELMTGGSRAASPEAEAFRQELRSVLEVAVARLPDAYRSVFVLREIEDLSLSEIAEALDVPEATVRTRSFRARRLLQQQLAPELKGIFQSSLDFAGADCEAMTRRVLERLGLEAD